MPKHTLLPPSSPQLPLPQPFSLPGTRLNLYPEISLFPQADMVATHTPFSCAPVLHSALTLSCLSLSLSSPLHIPFFSFLTTFFTFPTSLSPFSPKQAFSTSIELLVLLQPRNCLQRTSVCLSPGLIPSLQFPDSE